LDETENESQLNSISLSVNKRNTLAIVDTGTSVSWLRYKFARKSNIRVVKNNLKSRDLYTADGRKLGVVGNATVNIGLGDLKLPTISM